MSLINDALKQARQAQAQTTAPVRSGPQLRPAEPARQCARGAGLALPAAFAVVAMLALLFVGWVYRQSGSARLPQAAAPPQPVAQTKPVQPAVAPAAPVAATPAEIVRANPPAPAPTAPASAATPIALALGSSAPAAAIAPSPASTNLTTAAASATNVTNPPALADDAAPKPAPLKLQAIVFDPTRPSALISGKTVFLGDKVGGFRVAAIAPDRATLVGAGRTNVLTMPE